MSISMEMIQVQNYNFSTMIWQEDGMFVAKISEGIASAGDSREEAVMNLKEAIHLYLKNASELGLIRG